MTSRSTKKQQELLQFIDIFIKGNGYGPSYREIMRGLGYKSVSTVAVHIDSLIAKGYIRKKDHSARSIEIVTRNPELGSSSGDPTMQAHLTWLKNEINRRAVAESDVEEVKTLIDAAAILGVSQEEIEKFRSIIGPDEMGKKTA